jgi:hypothetical protein
MQGGFWHRAYVRLHHWLVPRARGQHWTVWTTFFTMAQLYAFAYMSGAFNFYRLVKEPKHEPSWAAVDWSVEGMRRWLIFWEVPDDAAFNLEFLIRWGGRYGPAIMAGESGRWVASIFLHSSFMHLISNVFTFLLLSRHLEAHYGMWRIFAVWLTSGARAAAAAAALPPPAHPFLLRRAPAAAAAHAPTPSSSVAASAAASPKNDPLAWAATCAARRSRTPASSSSAPRAPSLASSASTSPTSR